METEEKMVEIARFARPEEADVLLALLKSEGVDCYVRNAYSNRVLGGMVDIGGARVELLESAVPRALEIMIENGYDLPKEDELTPEVRNLSGIAKHIPFLRNFSLGQQILIMFAILAVCLGLLFLASMWQTGNNI